MKFKHLFVALLASVVTYSAVSCSATTMPIGPDSPDTAFPEDATIKGIKITNASSLETMKIGDIKTVELSITPNVISPNDSRITITSSDSSIIRVLDNHKIEALNAGSSTITVSGNYVTANMRITVYNPYEPVTEIRILNAEELRYMNRGESKTINLQLTPFTVPVDDPRVKISSDDPEIIAIEGKKLIALATGSATITVKADDARAQVTINVEETYTTMTISNKEALQTEWRIGDNTRNVEITTTPVGNAGELLQTGKLTIVSDHPEFVEVAGLQLKPKAIGRAKITVTLGEIVDTVDVEVLGQKVIECATIADIYTKVVGADGKYIPFDNQDAIQINVAIASTDGKENVVVTDGTNFFRGCRLNGGKESAIGENYTLTSKVNNYHGTLQFKQGTLTKLETTDIKVPTVVFTSEALLKEYKVISEVNDDGTLSGQKFNSIYTQMSAEYIGEDQYGFYAMVGNIKINLTKCNSLITEAYKAVHIGDIITIEGTILGYNPLYEYFNFISTKAPIITEKVIDPESVAITPFDITLKIYEAFSLTSTILPEGAKAKLTYTVDDPNKILIEDGANYMAIKAGTVTFTPHALGNNGEVIGEPYSVTFTEICDNAISRAKVCTIQEVATLNPTVTHKENLYIVEGVVETAENSEYGNVKLAAPDGTLSISTYGMGNSYFNFELDNLAPHNVVGFKNPKIFDRELLGKKFNIGDTIKIAIFADTYQDKPALKAIYLETTKVAPVETVANQLTVDSIGLKSQNYSTGTFTLDNVTYSYTELGNYGNGIQMRKNKDTTIRSSLENTTAFKTGVKEIKFVLRIGKDIYSNERALTITGGETSDALTETVYLNTVKGTREYTVNFAKVQKFVRINFTQVKGSGYYDSITFVE